MEASGQAPVFISVVKNSMPPGLLQLLSLLLLWWFYYALEA